jgi:hypothetical protein
MRLKPLVVFNCLRNHSFFVSEFITCDRTIIAFRSAISKSINTHAHLLIFPLLIFVIRNEYYHRAV